MDEIDNLLEKFVETFEENFSIFLVLAMDGEEISKLLEESLETGKPFRPEVGPDKIYQHAREILRSVVSRA